MAAYVQFNRPGKNGMSLDYGPFQYVMVVRDSVIGWCPVMKRIVLALLTPDKTWRNHKDGEVYTDVVIYTKED
jgi:hypothetical protein